MSFKKSVPNAASQKLLKMENKPEYRGTNVVFAGYNFKAREENPDFEINYGKNIFAESRL